MTVSADPALNGNRILHIPANGLVPGGNAKAAPDTGDPPKLVYPEDREPGEIANLDKMVVDGQPEMPDVEGMGPKLERVHLREDHQSAIDRRSAWQLRKKRWPFSPVWQNKGSFK